VDRVEDRIKNVGLTPIQILFDHGVMIVWTDEGVEDPEVTNLAAWLRFTVQVSTRPYLPDVHEYNVLYHKGKYWETTSEIDEAGVMASGIRQIVKHSHPVIQEWLDQHIEGPNE
jgi:hypothetical protein